MSEATALVVDASAVVDALLANESGLAVRRRLRGHALDAPAHLDAEVLSALARLERSGQATEHEIEMRIDRLAAMPVSRHPLPPLLFAAFASRRNLRVLDALYIELARGLNTVVITTDHKLAKHPLAELPG